MIYSVRFELCYKNITQSKTMTFETKLFHFQYKNYAQ